MRVTHNMKFDYSGLNDTYANALSAQKGMDTGRKVNRPSDDPAGSGQAISLRANLSRLNQYNGNISTAKGWLTSADNALSSVQTLLSTIKSRAQEGATGSVTAENRRQIAYELRESFMQLINLANTKYNGESLFAGHKTDSTAYELALGATYKDKATSVDGKDTATPNGSFPNQTQVKVTGIANGEVQYEVREWDSTKKAWGEATPLKALDREDKTELKLPGGKSLVVDTTKGNLKENKTQTFTVMDAKPTGSATFTTLIQATATDESGASGKASDAGVKFRYSTDGGSTWQDATKEVNADNNTVTITAGGTTTVISGDAWIEKVDGKNVTETRNGTWLYLRPTATYKGDDHDTQVVTNYGATAKGKAEGYYGSDVVTKITGIDPETNEVTFSYSLDNGTNWVNGRTTKMDGDTVKIPIPGGTLTLDQSGGNNIKVGDQFTVHPHRADVNLAISDTDSITLNLVGKDVFGGTYVDPITGENTIVGGGTATNVFEVVGRLIGYAETGNQEGMQKALEELQTSMKTVLTSQTITGGRVNRLESTADALDVQKLTATETLSNIEDADLTELAVEVEKARYIANAVSKSTSNIMQLSLLNYLS